MVKIDLVNLDDGFVLLRDGQTLPITNFIDEDGDDCEAEDAVVIVAGTEAFGFLSIVLGCEKVTVH